MADGTERCYIYVLIDPRNQEVRYVGSSIQPEQRLKSHGAEKKSKEKYEWVQELKQEGLLPRIHIVEEYSDWRKAIVPEMLWILRLANDGVRLFNKARHIPVDEETRLRNRADYAREWRRKKNNGKQA